jgi:hypothetical protein
MRLFDLAGWLVWAIALRAASTVFTSLPVLTMIPHSSVAPFKSDVAPRLPGAPQRPGGRRGSASLGIM